ncbi:MAG: hypothetical protein ACLFQX_09900 [Candidatus Kapaibacterium sp.]
MQVSNRAAGNWLMASGAIYLILLIGMTILIIATQSDEPIRSQIEALPGRPWWIAPYVAASMLALPLTAIMLVLAFFTNSERGPSIADMLGVILLPAYIVCVSVAYISQYAFLPYMLKFAGQESFFPFLRMMYFSEGSLIMYLDFIGYAIWGVSAMLIGWKFFYERGLQRVLFWLLYSAGITAIIGLIGVPMKDTGVQFFNTISGFITLPFAIFCIVIGKNLKKQ